jgi:hypothetical protein
MVIEVSISKVELLSAVGLAGWVVGYESEGFIEYPEGFPIDVTTLVVDCCISWVKTGIMPKEIVNCGNWG